MFIDRKKLYGVIFVINLFIVDIGGYEIEKNYKEDDKYDKRIHYRKLKRQKRFIFPTFPFNSCYALAAALAIPLQLKGRNVFMSYNFETNYYYPYFDIKQGIVPLPFATIDDPNTDLGTLAVAALQQQRKIKDSVSTAEAMAEQRKIEDFDSDEELADDERPIEESNSNVKLEAIIKSDNTSELWNIDDLGRENEYNERTTKQNKKSRTTNRPQVNKGKKNLKKTNIPKSRKARRVLDTFMSRKKFYSIIETKLRSHGVDGRDCLLRTICESAQNPINEHNGVLGDIIHIIFTPSTSRDEFVSKDYYKAEQYGNLGDCNMYNSCPINILDSITM